MRREHDNVSCDARHDGAGQRLGRRRDAGRIAAGVLIFSVPDPRARWLIDLYIRYRRTSPVSDGEKKIPAVDLAECFARPSQLQAVRIQCGNPAINAVSHTDPKMLFSGVVHS
jgi:hypothetical protein